jgi:hypothetical protein
MEPSVIILLALHAFPGSLLFLAIRGGGTGIKFLVDRNATSSDRLISHVNVDPRVGTVTDLGVSWMTYVYFKHAGPHLGSRYRRDVLKMEPAPVPVMLEADIDDRPEHPHACTK